MKLKSLLAFTLLCGSFSVYAVARAEGRGESRGEGRGRPARSEPPRYQPHPPGVHPHGAMVRSHAIRVLAPRMIVHGHGGREWGHWEHPEFTRPIYYWDWAAIHNVTCVAEDSYGDQYPVTEAAVPGFALGNMTEVEDDALDRCYSESGQDTTCYLATCTHY